MSEALILAELAVIKAKQDQILALLMGGNRAAPPAGNGGAGPQSGATASDQDLDGQHGNPAIRKDPPAKYWDGGTSYVGFHYSEVPEAAYLDALAKYFDSCAFMAAKDVAKGIDVERNEKTVRFKPLDAARCRGWAKRIRERGVAAPTPPPSPADADYGGGSSADDIPFAPPFDLGA